MAESYSGYCMSCKKMVEVEDSNLITMKNGRTRVSGVCSQSGCLAKISKILSWLRTLRRESFIWEMVPP